MTKPKKTSKRSNKAYINTAKTLKKFIPSLAKYTNSRSLTRYQKSAITRASNNLAKAKAVHGASLYPLSKRQYKALKDKTPVIRNGIRAVAFRSPVNGDRLHIRNGKIVIYQPGPEPKTWHYINVKPYPETIIAAAKKLFKKFKGKRIQVHLWLARGRASMGYRTFQLAYDAFSKKLHEYKSIDQWVFGLAYIAF